MRKREKEVGLDNNSVAHAYTGKMAEVEVRRVLVIYSGGTFGMVWNDAKRGKTITHTI